MSGKRLLIEVMLSAVAILSLLPTTLFWVFGLIISIAGFFSANDGVRTPAFLYLTVALIFIGYGLFSLWWLVLKFHTVTLKTIPKIIWLGLSIGIIVAIIFIAPYLLSGFNPPTPYISRQDNLKMFSIVGGGPLIVLAALIMYVWRAERGRDSKNE